MSGQQRMLIVATALHKTIPRSIGGIWLRTAVCDRDPEIAQRRGVTWGV